ncbi:CinA family protein [Micromonospora matsumotoense]|uniref:Competence/damage-inducible protein cinA n=1 Tax=Micromonospora matsumotoense TaxID=121616 RepID=A0A1C4ZXT4_9ACTN|nr:CinA family protein [Micromonospora matsumotoense]SCF37564.1 competence/damage-inducible protein cinA [Micromonospora matsumotoense]
MGTDAKHEQPVGNPAAGVVHSLHERQQTLATVESLTGGLLAAAIVDIAGASAVYRGGLVTYATELKARLADVPEELLAERGPVDPDVAIALAEGGRRRCAADWGLATTGVAGPEPQDGRPVGLVYVAVAGPGGPVVRRLDLDGGRDHIRAATVIEALRLLVARVHRAFPEAGRAPVPGSPAAVPPAGAGRR